MSFSDWLWENQYNPELISIFEDGMVPYGYGDVLDTPAVCFSDYLRDEHRLIGFMG